MEHVELLSMVRTAAEDVYACRYDESGNGEQPRLPGSDQIAVNSMGIIISWAWARQSLPGRHDNLRIYTAKYPSARAKDGHFQYVPDKTVPRAGRYGYGFLLDIFIEKEKKPLLPVLGAEIEASPVHETVYDYDRSDYLWDFCKLPYVSVPKRLFMACTYKAGLPVLQETLSRAWDEDLRHIIQDESDMLGVVLLPAGQTEWDEMRLGTAVGSGALTFKSPREIQ